MTALEKAEEILEILSSAYFTEILNQHSGEYVEPIGAMIERYWRETTRLRSVVHSRAEIEEGMREAWKIIDVLYMDALDHNGESWPRAREWQERWSRFKQTEISGARADTTSPVALDRLVRHLIYGDIEEASLAILGEDCPSYEEYNAMDVEQQTRLAAAATVAACLGRIPPNTTSSATAAEKGHD